MIARPAMDLARLADLLDRHGADIAAFPADERSAAASLLERDTQARELLASAQRLCHALDRVPAMAPSPALQRAVAEIPLRHPQPSQRGWALSWAPLSSARRLLLSAVAVVVLGAVSGALSADSFSAPSAADDDWSELSELAFATGFDQELAP